MTDAMNKPEEKPENKLNDRMRDQMSLELFLFGAPIRSIQDIPIAQPPLPQVKGEGRPFVLDIKTGEIRWLEEKPETIKYDLDNDDIFID